MIPAPHGSYFPERLEIMSETLSVEGLLSEAYLLLATAETLIARAENAPYNAGSMIAAAREKTLAAIDHYADGMQRVRARDAAVEPVGSPRSDAMRPPQK
jgi:hypothetical protein